MLTTMPIRVHSTDLILLSISHITLAEHGIYNLQFFVATSFLAMGLFITPLINADQPRFQGTLAVILFFALAVVVSGSLIGEAVSYHNQIKADGPWFWLGTQGWEYLDLGRFWQILLTTGMTLWVVILVRGIRTIFTKGKHR